MLFTPLAKTNQTKKVIKVICGNKLTVNYNFITALRCEAYPFIHIHYWDK